VYLRIPGDQALLLLQRAQFKKSMVKTVQSMELSLYSNMYISGSIDPPILLFRTLVRDTVWKFTIPSSQRRLNKFT
jgi:hypothetical protein